MQEKSARKRIEVDSATEKWVRIGSGLLNVTRPLYVKSAVAVFFRDTTPDAIQRNSDLIRAAQEIVPLDSVIRDLESKMGISFPEVDEEEPSPDHEQ